MRVSGWGRAPKLAGDMPDARTESTSPSPATGSAQDPGRPRRPHRRRPKKPADAQPTAPTGTADAAASAAQAGVAVLAARVEGLTAADREQLGRRLERLRGLRDDGKRQGALSDITARIEQAEQRVERRRLAVPEITYPEELPVSQLRDDIAAAIRDHQVVVIAGETGSGKTTQIPKICLELGRGVRGMIGHTQPRRIAARAVAERIAEEVGSPLGEAVGWKVRFTDQVSDKSYVKLMTDGILLTEIQHDRLLSAYDTIIID